MLVETGVENGFCFFLLGQGVYSDRRWEARMFVLCFDRVFTAEGAWDTRYRLPLEIGLGDRDGRGHQIERIACIQS